MRKTAENEKSFPAVFAIIPDSHEKPQSEREIPLRGNAGVIGGL